MLSGCAGSKPQVLVKEKTLPSWYTNPPLSSEQELYALGEGKDKKEAIAEWLQHSVYLYLQTIMPRLR